MSGIKQYFALSGLKMFVRTLPRALPWVIPLHRVAVANPSPRVTVPDPSHALAAANFHAPKQHHAIAQGKAISPCQLKTSTLKKRRTITASIALKEYHAITPPPAPTEQDAIAQSSALGIFGKMYLALKGHHSYGFVAFIISICLTIGCQQKTKEAPRKLEFDAFVPIYNRYIENWLKTQQAETDKELTKVTTELTTAQNAAKTALETKAKGLKLDQEKWNFRLGLGPYLKFSTPAEIPTDLVWENGLDEPEIGDPRAKKGGVLRKSIPEFPPTIRPIGLNSNNGFRSEIYDNVDMLLITYHRATGKLMPSVASEWAVSKDRRTVYFKIDPDARYSDGIPIKASDYLLTTYIYCSDYSGEPFQKQYFKENFAQFVAYDDKTLSISMGEANYFIPIFAGWTWPSPPHFYKEYGPDYSERYQWQFVPTAGAYQVRPEDIIKGVSITQTRVKNWWAKDKKFYRYRYNPDKITHTVVRENSKAFELFRAGEIDTFGLTSPEYWYEKSQMPPVYDGYIERATFYNRYPQPDLGLYLNTRKTPLDNLNVRIGIQYSMNWDKVNEILFRGEYKRKNSISEGFGIYSDSSIVARPYSIEESRKAFRTAGYTGEGTDGILKKPDGTRLEVSVTYSVTPNTERIFAILREQAKACGLDLKLDGSEKTISYKKQQQKQHQIAFTAYNTSLPVPDFYQFLHSSTAIDDKGNPKPQTNNLFGWARKDSDFLCERVRTAGTSAEIQDATWKLQRMMHDEAIFVPGYSVDFFKLGYWRWVKWPDCPDTRFSPPVVSDPLDAHVLWIDEDLQKETLAARRAGKTFPESTRVFDDYREQPAVKTEAKEP
jgi:microcin C transport system substrate-binding protein